jgi:integrase
MPRTRQPPGLRVVTRKGTATYYLRGTVRGIRVYESAGTTDEALAHEARAAREAQLFRGSVHGFATARVSWAEAALSYLQAEPRAPSTLIFVQRLTRHFGTKACRDIDQVAIDAACRALCRPTAKPATKLRNVVGPARAVLLHACRRGWCDAPRFEIARPSPARTDWLTPAEAEAMIAAAERWTKHVRPLLIFLFCTGARMGEALALTWDDVDLRHARAVLRDTKGGGDRLLDLPPRAVAELANLPGRKAEVFRAWGGAAYRATNASQGGAYGGQIAKAWATCAKAAGIRRHVTPHHARHTWASWHYAVHKDLLLLRRDGGWAKVDMAERYAHLTPPGLAPEIVRFWGVSACAQMVQTDFQAAKKEG